MQHLRSQILHLLPRILAFGFVAFISIFALDVLGEYEGLELVVALSMHLLPSLFLLTAILVAWKYKLAGAAAFFGFAAWYVWWAGFDKTWSWYALIALPSVLIGALYVADWLINVRSHYENKS